MSLQFLLYQLPQGKHHISHSCSFSKSLLFSSEFHFHYCPYSTIHESFQPLSTFGLQESDASIFRRVMYISLSVQCGDNQPCFSLLWDLPSLMQVCVFIQRIQIRSATTSISTRASPMSAALPFFIFSVVVSISSTPIVTTLLIPSTALSRTSSHFPLLFHIIPPDV